MTNPLVGLLISSLFLTKMLPSFLEKHTFEYLTKPRKPMVRKHPLSVEVKISKATCKPRYFSLASISLSILWYTYHLSTKELLWVNSIKLQIFIHFLLSRGQSWIYSHCFHKEKTSAFCIAHAFFTLIIFFVFSRLLVHLISSFDTFKCFLISLQGIHIAYTLIIGSRALSLAIYRSRFKQRLHTRYSYPPFFSIISKHKTYQKCGCLKKVVLNKQLIKKAQKENLHHWAKTKKKTSHPNKGHMYMEHLN